MSGFEWMDERIGVEGIIHGVSLIPRQIAWRKKEYTVVSTGRQWEEDGEIHIMLELSDTARMEVGFSCKKGWRAIKYWSPPTAMA